MTLTAPLPHLDTFTEAAERLSFTAAARALSLTQAAVSQRIQVLERELGVPLFKRTGGRVEITEAGRRLHDFARRISDLHREARQEVSGRETPLAGDLSIAASSIPGQHLLPALLASFGSTYPLIRVRAAISDSAAVIGQVTRGEISLGLVGRRDEDPHLAYRHIAEDRIVLVVPRGHFLTRKKAATLDHLATLPLILRETGSGLRHCFEKGLERAGRSPSDLRVVLELGSNEAIKEAVVRGVGVAVLSALAIDTKRDASRLRTVEFEGLTCAREMFAVTDRRRVLSRAARNFLGLLDTATHKPG